MKKLFIFLGVTVFINIIFRVIIRLSPEFSDWYAGAVYPVIARCLGWFFGFFPFSAAEIIIMLLTPLFFIWLIIFIIILIRRKKSRKLFLIRSGSCLLCGISCLALVYLFNCEINYQRYPFSHYSGLEIRTYSTEELRAVIDEINSELYKITPNITTGNDGEFIFDNNKLSDISVSAMNDLGEFYPCLEVYYPRPKPIILSELILSRTLTCGIYSPFTIEANYNTDMPDSEKPFTVCHELSHLSSFMREDEANFISFLACRESGDADFMYSGYVRALVYCLNAYYGAAGEDEYFALFREIPEQVKRELRYSNDYWRPYRNTKIAEISETVNDTYLKANGQSDGTKSYGRLVDLLIAEYNSRKNKRMT